MSVWASEKNCIHIHQPPCFFSFVESPNDDFALILLAVLLFYNYSNGRRGRKKKKEKERGLRTALLHSALTSSVLKSESIELDAAIIVFLKSKKKWFALKISLLEENGFTFLGVLRTHRWLITVREENYKLLKTFIYWAFILILFQIQICSVS